jgi:uncharacterized membrane protein
VANPVSSTFFVFPEIVNKETKVKINPITIIVIVFALALYGLFLIANEKGLQVGSISDDKADHYK